MESKIKYSGVELGYDPTPSERLPLKDISVSISYGRYIYGSHPGYGLFGSRSGVASLYSNGKKLGEISFTEDRCFNWTTAECHPYIFVTNGGPLAPATANNGVNLTGRWAVAIEPDGRVSSDKTSEQITCPFAANAVVVHADMPTTGFGTQMAGSEARALYSVERDAHAFAEFVRAYLYDAAETTGTTPAYGLLGSSYAGGFRNVAASLYLEDAGLPVGGLASVSADYDRTLLRYHQTEDIRPFVTFWPAMALAAQYHRKVDRSIGGMPPEVLYERVARLARVALEHYHEMPSAQKRRMLGRLALYTGMRDLVFEHEGLIPPNAFRSGLLKDEGRIISAIDSRLSYPADLPIDIDPLLDTLAEPSIKVLRERYDLNDVAYTGIRPVAGDWFFSNIWQSQDAYQAMATLLERRPDLYVLNVSGLYDMTVPAMRTDIFWDRMSRHHGTPVTYHRFTPGGLYGGCAPGVHLSRGRIGHQLHAPAEDVSRDKLLAALSGFAWHVERCGKRMPAPPKEPRVYYDNRELPVTPYFYADSAYQLSLV